MPLLQSVFCLQGHDDRSRFFALSGLIMFAFVLFSLAFTSYFIINLIFLLFLTSVLTLTTIRRLRDAKLSKSWQLIPSGLFFFMGLIILMLDNNISYSLLILPSLISALLLTYPSQPNRKEKKYYYGYYGPVDLSHYHQNAQSKVVHSQRIEPTLASGTINTNVIHNDSMPSSYSNQDNSFSTETITSNKEQIDLGELIRSKLLHNKKLQKGLVIGFLIILTLVIISSFIMSNNHIAPEKVVEKTTENLAEKTNESNVNQILASKSQHLPMPDNFELYLTPYQGVLLHWQADSVKNGSLWSQLTTKGDKTCQMIHFNKDNDFRPLSVEVENNTDYFAIFSPIDTPELIKALAFRGSFSLCGYDFSLKGSQAALGKHGSYAPFLDR